MAAPERVTSDPRASGRYSPPGSLSNALLRWFAVARRPLPWRRHPTPYSIWVAEVLLQQTRVAQAIPYYRRFLRKFPTVRALARASEQDVLKLWEGAGYYARARHLHAAARKLVRERRGVLPRTAEELRELPGVGPYIANAVASLAFDEPVLALEANGIRIAARLTLERGDVRTPRVRTRLASALETQLPRNRAGAFNEALMELGETICQPVVPQCPRCPVRRFCLSYRTLERPGEIPVRPTRPRRPHVVASVVAVESHGRWFVQRRDEPGLLQGLWEFPGGKLDGGESPLSAARRELLEETGLRARRLTRLAIIRHAYSHFTVELHLFGAHLPEIPSGAPDNGRWVTLAEMRRLPLPAATRRMLGHLDERSTTSRGSGSRPGRRPA
ncbi:MAG: NUDIX domain-containing protein [Thermoplasmata archaeon]